jgi:uncharacterized membrane protein HdeD (DUF308 family)
MIQLASKYWWAFVLRGLLAVVFGIMAVSWPGLTLIVLVYIFGIYVLVEGALLIFSALGRRGVKNWWVVLIEGIAGVVFGILTMSWPGVTAILLLIFIAIWALGTGILEIFAALRLRKEMKGEWRLAVSGIASVIFGLILVFRPGAGALAMVWVIGIYAIVFGISLILLGFKVRKAAVPSEAETPA